jgi:hypothetical protein
VSPHAAALLALAALAAAPARAQIYRCPGPDGQPVFTSDASACPGAPPHAPTRDVQRVEPSGPSWSGDPALAGEAPPRGARPLAPPAAAAGEPEDAQAAMWKRKRTEAEAELRSLERGQDELREIVTWCNRGGELVVEDEVGVRDRYDCDDAREAHAQARARATALRAYLAGGLEDECRRAGCLPGWIR